MIEFQNDLGLNQIANLVKKTKGPILPYSLYVFGANEARPALIYVSPHLAQASRITTFLNGRIGTYACVETIGNPAQAHWVAFHKRIREGDPRLCARICLFVERALHNLIIW